MGRVEQQVVGQGQQPAGQRAVQRARHLLDRLFAVGMEVRATDVADQQRVAGEHEPRVVDPRVVRDQVGVVCGGVAGVASASISVLPSFTVSRSASGWWSNSTPEPAGK